MDEDTARRVAALEARIFAQGLVLKLLVKHTFAGTAEHRQKREAVCNSAERSLLARAVNHEGLQLHQVLAELEALFDPPRPV